MQIRKSLFSVLSTLALFLMCISPSRRFSYNDQRSDLSMNEIRVIKDICYDSEKKLLLDLYLLD